MHVLPCILLEAPTTKPSPSLESWVNKSFEKVGLLLFSASHMRAQCSPEPRTWVVMNREHVKHPSIISRCPNDTKPKWEQTAEQDTAVGFPAVFLLLSCCLKWASPRSHSVSSPKAMQFKHLSSPSWAITSIVYQITACSAYTVLRHTHRDLSFHQYGRIFYSVQVKACEAVSGLLKDKK